MTLPATSAIESYLIGTQSNQPISAEQNVYTFVARSPIALAIPNSVSIDDLVNEFELDPAMATHMQEARRTLANEVFTGTVGTLSHIRLNAGLSQTQLAGIVGTSQSHIARIEAGKNDPSTEIIGKIAEALQTNPTAIFTSIFEQRRSA